MFQTFDYAITPAGNRRKRANRHFLAINDEKLRHSQLLCCYDMGFAVWCTLKNGFYRKEQWFGSIKITRRGDMRNKACT